MADHRSYAVQLRQRQLVIPGSIRHTKSAALGGTEMDMRDTEVRA